MEFSLTQEWINSYPSRRKHAMVKEGIINFIVLAFSAYLGEIYFYIGIALTTIYWVTEYKSYDPDKIKALSESMKINITDSGLYEICTGLGKIEPIKLLTPWNEIKIVNVKYTKGEVCKITFTDRVSPFKRHIENYDNMGLLLNEINKKLDVSTTPNK